MVSYRALVFSALCFFTGAHSMWVTPMEKVITLLKDLSAKVAAEGKAEAVEYDRYACFCKDQSDEKLHNIEKSDAKLARLEAEIKQFETAIAALNSDISSLSTKISDLEKEIKEKTEKREEGHQEYLLKAKDMSEAIDACAVATKALKDSKKSMKGAKVDLAQVKKAMAGVMSLVSSHSLLSVVPGAVALIEKVGDKAAPKFEYQSNDIIATLESLSATFKKMKKHLDEEEFEANASFETNKLGLSNEKKFKEKAKSEKEAIVAAKTEELESTKTDRDQETADRNSDQRFVDELTKDCEEKAGLFDQRSKTRASELTALAEATGQLQKGATPNYAVNKKLVDLQKKAPSVRKAKVSVGPVSFVQISNVQHDSQDDVNKKGDAIQKAVGLIKDRAGHSGSKALASLVLRISTSEDHFVKVRSLIKDLISKLEADALAESDQKSTCDKNMQKEVSERDEANGHIEQAEAKITTYTANQNAIEAEMQETTKQIAEAKKALLEATELRADEKAANAKAVKMSAEGISAVKMALQLLQEFYGDAKLVQMGKYVPPDSDRDGNTVGDLSPKVFDSKYHGAKAESNGIIGILEVILSDFERTEDKTEKDEESSKAAFEMFESDTEEEVSKKEAKVKTLEGDLADVKSDILEQQQSLKDSKNMLASAEAALESLRSMCVQGEESWEERKKKREAEVEALKDALSILENWQA